MHRGQQVSEGHGFQASLPLLQSKAQTCPSPHHRQGTGSQRMSTKAGTALGDNTGTRHPCVSGPCVVPRSHHIRQGP